MTYAEAGLRLGSDFRIVWAGLVSPPCRARREATGLVRGVPTVAISQRCQFRMDAFRSNRPGSRSASGQRAESGPRLPTSTPRLYRDYQEALSGPGTTVSASAVLVARLARRPERGRLRNIGRS